MRTDGNDEAIVAFRNFAHAPKKRRGPLNCSERHKIPRRHETNIMRHHEHAAKYLQRQIRQHHQSNAQF